MFVVGAVVVVVGDARCCWLCIISAAVAAPG